MFAVDCAPTVDVVGSVFVDDVTQEGITSPPITRGHHVHVGAHHVGVAGVGGALYPVNQTFLQVKNVLLNTAAIITKCTVDLCLVVIDRT